MNCRGCSGSKPGPRTSTERKRIRCFRRREYDHFKKDCANMKAADHGQPEEMQHLISTEEEDRSLQLFAGETYNSLTKEVSD